MAEDRHIYGEVNNKTDLRHLFRDIRKDVDDADSRADLTELYRRAGYMITLSYAPSWEKKFGGEARELREVAEEEFARTARKVNRQAEQIGSDADYDERWGEMKRHG